VQAADAKRDPNAVLRAASQKSNDRARLGEVSAAISGVALDTTVDAAIRRRAFEMLIDVQARLASRAKAIEAAEALRLAFPKDAAIDRQAVFVQADHYAQMPAAVSNTAPAVAVLQAYVKRHPDDNESSAQAFLRMARLQVRAEQYDAARESARTALERDPANAALGSEALWLLQDIAKRTDKPEDRARALEQSLDPKYRDALSDEALTLRRTACADALRQLKRYDDLRRFLADFELTDASPVRRQQWCLATANAYFEQGRTNDASVAYERVFTAHPDANASWYEAQSRVVDLLVAQKRTNDALRAAHVLYDARGGNDAERVIKRMADILRWGDPKDPRADALQAMQRHGPAGRDGQPGTEDDPQPVLPTIGYPDATARRRAFAAASATLGDGVEASLQRAWCAVYTGEPRQATAHFADALRRCSISQVADIAKLLQQYGVRPLDGNGDRLADIGDFIAYGPGGVDGQSGTADDLADPFAALGVPATSAHPGGLVPLPPNDVRDLQALIPELRELIRRSTVSERRAAAVDLYQRTVEALVVVDRRETLEWVLAALQDERDPRVLGALAHLGANVARSDQLHVAAARQFHAEVTGALERSQRKLPGEVVSVQRQLEGLARALERKPKTR
jgi:tetratricopeptide (TPR) repeat protein